MSAMTTARLPYTEYYLPIMRGRNSKWQRKRENGTNKLHYIKPFIEEWKNTHNSWKQYEVKLSRICIGCTRETQTLDVQK